MAEIIALEIFIPNSALFQFLNKFSHDTSSLGLHNFFPSTLQNVSDKKFFFYNH